MSKPSRISVISEIFLILYYCAPYAGKHGQIGLCGICPMVYMEMGLMEKQEKALDGETARRLDSG